MSREFETFCIDHGIQRQHTVRNCPQQNGVAERANRTMEEGIISMLYESGMPPSFWGKALSSFIHTHNRVTTTTLPGSTPHKAFLGTKPDLSMLHVWGCTAYVLIQKDNRPLGSLGSHMEKCIFIGYPQGYKAWKFNNPETKKVMISERADFDEHFFLNKRHSLPSLPTPPRLDSLLESSPPIVPLPESLDDILDDNSHSSQLPVHGGDEPMHSEQPPVRPETPPSPLNLPHYTNIVLSFCLCISKSSCSYQ
jgi:hypothetical protein